MKPNNLFKQLLPSFQGGVGGSLLMGLLFALFGILTVSAQKTETYAVYTSNNTTLTFYYDNLRSSRTGTSYDLNTGDDYPGWYNDHTYSQVTKVVFDALFVYARPTGTYYWFYGMNHLANIIGLEYLNTSESTNLGDMFNGCSSLTSIDLSGFNTANVTNMYCMFLGCTALTTLDLASFNTENVVNMSGMFRNCTALTTIYVSDGWSTAKALSNANMFYNCTSLRGGNGTTYDENNVGRTYARIDGGTSKPGYFTDFSTREAYAELSSNNTKLTFYYDSQRSSRTGTTYTINPSGNTPGWHNNITNVTNVVFAPSFASARPTTTYMWFSNMTNLVTITGIQYLNTSRVIEMKYMFFGCNKLTTIDVYKLQTPEDAGRKRL